MDLTKTKQTKTSTPKTTILFLKITYNWKTSNNFRSRHRQLLSWKALKFERSRRNGFRTLPKTYLKQHFANFREFLIKYFWTKWVANFFLLANFMLISEKWLWSLEYPFNVKYKALNHQGPVVQRVDNFIQRINPYLVGTICSLSNQN